MIREENNVFILETQNTSYIFQIMKSGHLEHLYYGRKLYLGETSRSKTDGIRAVSQKYINNTGGIAYTQDNVAISMNDVRLEMSGHGTGDFRS